MIKCKVQGKPSPCGKKMQVTANGRTKHVQKKDGSWYDRGGKRYEIS
jgi:hypothetical protein